MSPKKKINWKTRNDNIVKAELADSSKTIPVPTCSLGLDTHLFSKILDQETAKGPFLSSSQAATCYYTV